MKPLIAAIQFLTIFPAGISTDEKDLGRSSPWFAIAGLCVGGISALAYWLSLKLDFPVPVASCLAVISLAVFSGGLHLDGLADSADGLFSHRRPDRILEIMRDSRIGTMGVLALLFSVLLKWLALSGMKPELAVQILVLAPCSSRAAMSLSLSIFPYARQDGLAKVFIGSRHPVDPVLPIALAMAAGWFIAGVDGLIIAAIPLVAGILFSLWCLRKIGGITGDTLGAVSEIGEIGALLAALVILYR